MAAADFRAQLVAAQAMNSSMLCVGLDQGAGWGAVREDAGRVTQALQPWASGSAYLLMADAEVDERRGWPAGAWQRLVDIREAADPQGLFLAPRPSAPQP